MRNSDSNGPEMKLEYEDVGVDFAVPVNADGVVDGLALAEAMFQKGFSHILTYTNGCTACAGAIMGVFGDRVMDAAKTSLKFKKGVDSASLVFEEDIKLRADAIRIAVADARPRVKELLLENALRCGRPHSCHKH